VSTTKPLVIFCTGSTFPLLKESYGDFQDWILRVWGSEYVVVIKAFNDDLLPEPSEVAGAVFTGSHAMVTDRAPWSERLAEWIKDAHKKQVPMLGICYGHQLIAHALGGEVGYREQGMEIGTHDIQLTDAAHTDALFSALPPHFCAHLVHSQSVIKLPLGAQVLARNAADPHQSYRVGKTTWGVQFHPEFDEHIMQFYGDEVAAQDCANAKTIITKNTADAAKLLTRFATLAKQHSLCTHIN
jgi:GMP synthase (glutamine-hydrolysing)